VAIACIFGILLLFQFSFVSAFLVTIIISIIVVEVAGYMGHFDLDLSTWAYTNIVISIG